MAPFLSISAVVTRETATGHWRWRVIVVNHLETLKLTGTESDSKQARRAALEAATAPSNSNTEVDHGQD